MDKVLETAERTLRSRCRSRRIPCDPTALKRAGRFGPAVLRALKLIDELRRKPDLARAVELGRTLERLEHFRAPGRGGGRKPGEERPIVEEWWRSERAAGRNPTASDAQAYLLKTYPQAVGWRSSHYWAESFPVLFRRWKAAWRKAN